jgi:hypothetical protein
VNALRNAAWRDVYIPFRGHIALVPFENSIRVQSSQFQLKSILKFRVKDRMVHDGVLAGATIEEGPALAFNLVLF